MKQLFIEKYKKIPDIDRYGNNITILEKIKQILLKTFYIGIDKKEIIDDEIFISYEFPCFLNINQFKFIYHKKLYKCNFVVCLNNEEKKIKIIKNRYGISNVIFDI
jgi:hypothetical protein